jgi:hypothetical protein
MKMTFNEIRIHLDTAYDMIRFANSQIQALDGAVPCESEDKYLALLDSISEASKAIFDFKAEARKFAGDKKASSVKHLASMLNRAGYLAVSYPEDIAKGDLWVYDCWSDRIGTKLSHEDMSELKHGKDCVAAIDFNAEGAFDVEWNVDVNGDENQDWSRGLTASQVLAEIQAK